MKVLAVIFSLIATSRAASLLVPEVGASSQYKSEDNLGNYAFGYNEDHTSGGSFRKEYGDSFGNKVGSYGLHNADGRARVVNYVADSAGFRANVHTNEPGVDPSQDPADVTVNKPVVVAPAATVVASPIAAVAPVTVTKHHHIHGVTLYPAPLFHAPIALAPLFAHAHHVLL